MDESNSITLMKEMNVEGWKGSDSGNILYPSPDEMGIIYAKIEWGLPHPDNKLKHFLSLSLSLSHTQNTLKIKE